MSTRANIFIRDNQSDRNKQVIYAHSDGYPKGVGRNLERTLRLLNKDDCVQQPLNKNDLADFICEHNPDWLNTTPSEVGDAEYNYEIDLERRRVDWQHLTPNGDIIEEEYLCDFL